MEIGLEAFASPIHSMGESEIGPGNGEYHEYQNGCHKHQERSGGHSPGRRLMKVQGDQENRGETQSEGRSKNVKCIKDRHRRPLMLDINDVYFTLDDDCMSWRQRSNKYFC